MKVNNKNLVYIFADQWRAHAVGFAGCDRVITPNMDEFAAGGMKFTNAISTYPLCSPHRAALMTGKYPASCGFWTNCKPGLDEVIMLKPQERCVSDELSAAGYHTGYIGKWHLDGSELNFFCSPSSGADVWDAYTPPGERRHGFDFWHSYGAMDNHTYPHYWEDSEKPIKPGRYSPEHETDVTLDFIKSAPADRPFALFLSWNPPHPPYELIPEKYLERYPDCELVFRDNVPQEMRDDPNFRLNMRRYFAAVSALDDQFGRIVRFLRESGRMDDTVLVLSADHGDTMGSHGIYGKNVWYEESINIPLVFGGGGIKEGRCDALFASPDHMPTLLELLDIAVPDTVQGTSLAGAVQGQKLCDEAQTAFLCMMPGMPDMVREYTRRGLYSRCFGWRGVRTKTHTYVVDNGTVPGQEQCRYLYDNINDPFQLSPVRLRAEDEENRKYEAVLRDYLTRLGDGFLLDREGLA